MPTMSNVIDDNSISIVSVCYRFGLIGYLMLNAVMMAFLPWDLSPFVDNELPTLPMFYRLFIYYDFIDDY